MDKDLKALPNLTQKMNLLSLVILVLIVTIFALHYYREETKYFEEKDGKSFPLTPLYEPNVSTKALLRWATLAATSAYTMDFVHYEKTLDEIRSFFTQAGYDNYINTLTANNFIEDVRLKKLIVSAVLVGTPVVLSEKVYQGFYTWNIQLPLLITFQGASEKASKERRAVTLLVTRVPTKDASTGIGIAQITDKMVSRFE